ncbi:MAG: signal recognition particle-docking protein FtsY [Clostridia bacterium]|nr:signal recognition particle-docking protein FtsY [Clostridia bacterium]
MSFFAKLKNGLTKTKKEFSEKINSVFSAFVKVDEELFEELEEILIMSDVGFETTEYILDELRDKVKKSRIEEPDEIKNVLIDIISEILIQNSENVQLNTKPSVIIVVGVNGVGKTTSIGKIASYYKSLGKNVLLAAADTFRAAAAEQLQIWAERVDCDIVRHNEGADPSAVVFDAISAAKNRGSDLVICDTAGRLHNKKNLMNELEKIVRTVNRELPDADKEILLVLDATTGQNAITQAKLFDESTGLTGLVLTKLDGTAKGGVIIGLANSQKLPVRFVGVGEQIDDLQPFNPEEFAKALFE